MSRLTLALLIGIVVIADGCAKPDVRHALKRDALSPDPSPRLLAVYEPWFGGGDHMSVGYSSQDPEVLRRQVEQARSFGISAFVVDWYGDRVPFLDKSFALLQQTAAQKQFYVALMYDETEGTNGQATDDAIAAFDKAYKDYFGPGAAYRQAYLLQDGRPIVFVFPKQGHTDWNRVRTHINSWPNPPLLFYKDEPPPEYRNAFDGSYPWVHPGPKGWAGDGSDWGREYLEKFYKRMKDEHRDKIAVGAVWPGFDDRHAPWGLNRYMNPRCGETFQDGLRLFRDSFDPGDLPQFLLIETWNDYEEGTAIERLNFANCKLNA